MSFLLPPGHLSRTTPSSSLPPSPLALRCGGKTEDFDLFLFIRSQPGLALGHEGRQESHHFAKASLITPRDSDGEDALSPSLG